MLEQDQQDVTVIEINQLSVNPNPENPIARHHLRPELSSVYNLSPWWESSDDRQYSVMLKGFAIYTATWCQLEDARAAAAVAHENPARAWSVRGDAPSPTPLLHPASLHAILAPRTALYTASAEISMLEDVTIHVCTPQLHLLLTIAKEFVQAYVDIVEATSLALNNSSSTCMFIPSASTISVVDRATMVPQLADSGCDSAQDDASSYSVSSGRPSLTTVTGRGGEVYITARALNATLYEQTGSKMLALLHARLIQPSVFLISRESTSLSSPYSTRYQISLYDLWLGCARDEPPSVGTKSPEEIENTRSPPIQLPGAEACPLAVLDTGKGIPDPVTHIRPALITIHAQDDMSVRNSRMRIKVLVERPLRLQLCEERARRIHDLRHLLFMAPDPTAKLPSHSQLSSKNKNQHLRRLHETLSGVESIEVTTSHLVARLASSRNCEYESVAVGVIALEAKLSAQSRPDMVVLRGLVKALAASAPTSLEKRKERTYLLHPTTFGLQATAVWEPWRKRCEPGNFATKGTPTGGYGDSCGVRVLIETGCITLEAAPYHAIVLQSTLDRLKTVTKTALHSFAEEAAQATDIGVNADHMEQDEPLQQHFFKDDLRNGAFKVSVEVPGSTSCPMAYQVIVGADTLTWRYPHPRTLTRVLVCPLPLEKEDKYSTSRELTIAVEFYCEVTSEFQQLGYMVLRETETAELRLHLNQASWSEMWRVRLTTQSERISTTPEMARCQPEFDPLVYGITPPAQLKRSTSQTNSRTENAVTLALAGALRVDSCQAERSVPRVSVTARAIGIDLRIHTTDSPTCKAEPLRRAYTGISVHADQTAVHLRVAPSVTTLTGELTLNASVLEPDTLQRRLALGPARVRTHCCRQGRGGTVRMHVDTLHVTLAPHHLRLLRRLYRQWSEGTKKYCKGQDQDDVVWLRYWLYNQTERMLHIGQQGTRECVNLSPGASMAYAWRSAHAPRRLTIALPDGQPSLDCVELDMEGHKTVRLENDTRETGSICGHVTVRAQPDGSIRFYFTGRILLTNTTQKTFQYKVRVKSKQDGAQTVCGGMLPPLCTNCTVLCPEGYADQLYIKFKLADGSKTISNNENWTGDVPLRECADRSAPWLVKVPCGGEMGYICIWCRVVRPPPPDSRVLVMLWPLYMVTSELPLEVLVRATSTSETGEKSGSEAQIVGGRGASTPLIVPGTTHTKHELYFRYRDMNTQVTHEAIPLHYSLSSDPVLTKPIANKNGCDIETLLKSVQSWLARHKQPDGLELEDEEDDIAWPYSLVTRHIPGEWIPSQMPPNTNITVDYKRVDAGAAGCSLELQLRPQSLFCNASGRIFTLRAHDFTHLCTVQPGQVVAPPHRFPQEMGWTLSFEEGSSGRWMSIGMSVARSARGHYEHGPPGEVAPDKPALLHIVSPSRDKVMLLSLFYELHRGIEVVGISTTHLIRNLTSNLIFVCGVALWSRVENGADPEPVSIWPLANQYTPIFVHSENSSESTSLDTFVTQGAMDAGMYGGGHWRTYLCVTLMKPGRYEDQEHDETNFVPICLDVASPTRKTVALWAQDQTFKTFCITIQKLSMDLEGRTLVEISEEKHAEFVVQNLTKLHIVVASTQNMDRMEPEEECPGVLWQRHIPSGTTLHYSSPAYCGWLSKCDPDATRPKPCLLLTACTLRTEWGSLDPYAEQGGPVLMLVACDTHIKVIVQRRPLDTLITIYHVDKSDVSAADIRQRLESAGTVSDMSLTTLFEEEANQIEKQNVLINVETGCCTEESAPETITDSAWRCDVAVRRAIVTMREPRGEAAVLALHLDMLRLLLRTYEQSMEAQICVLELQLDNAQCERTDIPYDFPVVIVGQGKVENQGNAFPTLWALEIAPSDPDVDMITVNIHTRTHNIANKTIKEIQSIEVRSNQLSIYLEDRFLAVLLPYMDQFRSVDHACALCRPRATPGMANGAVVPQHVLQLSRELRNPMRLNALTLHSLPLLLSLHTSAWLYVALDHSPLNLSEFKRTEIAARPARFIRALAYHYLSGAIFGAGWVVGGLEVLGAPGTLVRRVGEGLRAMTAGGGAGALCGSLAAGALHSLAALCSSLARNLDLLAGDEQHIVRAAAQRRRRPRNFPEAVITGLTGLAASLLSGLGGLTRSPLSAPRAAILGVVTKPLSATADFVAMSSQGLLCQAGWDICPQMRALSLQSSPVCVDMAGEEILSLGSDPVLYTCRVHSHGHTRPLLLLLTTERLILVGDFDELVESLDFSRLALTATRSHTHIHADAHIVHVDVRAVPPPPPSNVQRIMQDDMEEEVDDTPDYEAREEALARVARYTGVADPGTLAVRVLRLRTPSVAHAQQLRSHLIALLQRPQSGFTLV